MMNEPLDAIEFPAACFNQTTVYVAPTAESATVCTRAALAGGWYDGLLVVGSNSVAVRIKNARKLHGVGLFWGYNIFLNQRIRVELVVEEKGLNLSLEEVKTLVFASFRKRYGWRTRGDFKDLCAWVKEAKSVAEIITALTSRDTATRS
jgi:hypothetical protein